MARVTSVSIGARWISETHGDWDQYERAKSKNVSGDAAKGQGLRGLIAEAECDRCFANALNPFSPPEAGCRPAAPRCLDIELR